MKLTFRFALAVLIISLVASCKKDHGGTDLPVTFIGSWELSQVMGSLPTLNLPAGNGNILVLTATTYAFHQNGVVTKSGTYTLKDDPTAEQNVCLVIPAGTFT